MGIAAKALLGAAGLFLAIALISLSVNLFGTAQEGSKQAQTEFSSIQTELSGQTYAGYDNTILTGSQVVNAIRKFGNKETFTIKVTTKKNTGGTTYSKGNVGGTTEVTSNEYINPSGQFKSIIVRDVNNVVTGIEFSQS
ncbi:ABC transporter permease [Paenibacillus jiagnxiensis]|uniref:ABC transporter permease n=1 Tax=Paenibacillus jiagnxiensis TaxID=3228926 RepID=UPI0033B6B8DC